MTDQPELVLVKDLKGGQQIAVALDAGFVEHGTQKDGNAQRTNFDVGAAFLLKDGRIIAGPIERSNAKDLAEALLENGRSSTKRENWLALAIAAIAFSDA